LREPLEKFRIHVDVPDAALFERLQVFNRGFEQGGIVVHKASVGSAGRPSSPLLIAGRRWCPDRPLTP
jgi:hypothetical protein